MPSVGTTEVPLSDLNYNQLDQHKRPVPKEQHRKLQSVSAAHVGSFNFMLDTALPAAVDDLQPVEIKTDTANVSIRVRGATIAMPTDQRKRGDLMDRTLYPTECRERRITYAGNLHISLEVRVEGEAPWILDRVAGKVPIMVKSSRCHLDGLTPAELIRRVHPRRLPPAHLRAAAACPPPGARRPPPPPPRAVANPTGSPPTKARGAAQGRIGVYIPALRRWCGAAALCRAR